MYEPNKCKTSIKAQWQPDIAKSSANSDSSSPGIPDMVQMMSYRSCDREGGSSKSSK